MFLTPLRKRQATNIATCAGNDVHALLLSIDRILERCPWTKASPCQIPSEDPFALISEPNRCRIGPSIAPKGACLMCMPQAESTSCRKPRGQPRCACNAAESLSTRQPQCFPRQPSHPCRHRRGPCDPRQRSPKDNVRTLGEINTNLNGRLANIRSLSPQGQFILPVVSFSIDDKHPSS